MNQSCDLKPTSNRYINSNLKRGGGGSGLSLWKKVFRARVGREGQDLTF